MIGQSPAYLATLRAASITAATDVTTLILGDSGTGKELLAHYIHQQSRRANRPFVTINCAALPEELAESELFGHRKGAFTGASQDQPGRVISADGGSLFLDEVGELPLGTQAKLLRFLESGECQPVGQAETCKVDVRIIAATNRDLQEAVSIGTFRNDLFYRLNVVPLQLPALTERRDDIELLLRELTQRLAREHEIAAPRYSKEAIKALLDHAWPGNVRELRNLAERMLILFSGKTIQKENLPIEIRQHADSRPVTEAAFALPENGIELEQLEVSMIRQALNKAAGNQSKAARLLGLTRSTLLYRLKKYALG